MVVLGIISRVVIKSIHISLYQNDMRVKFCTTNHKHYTQQLMYYCAKCIYSYNNYANIYGYNSYANLFINTFFTRI